MEKENEIQNGDCKLTALHAEASRFVFLKLKFSMRD